MKFNTQKIAIHLILFILVINYGCQKDTISDPSKCSDDYWPMETGNTWTFNYSYYFRNWNVSGIGKAIEGTYSGTLTWEIISNAQTQTEVRSTFKQRFIGIGNEIRYASTPRGYDSVTYNIVDSISTFDITVGSDQIIRLSANAYPIWESMSLNTVFTKLDIFRFLKSDVPHDSIIIYSDLLNAYPKVTMARMVGPVSIAYKIGGNSARDDLSVDLISYKQSMPPNQRLKLTV